MRVSNGMGRVKYRSRYSSHKRVRRRKWAKRLLIVLLVATVVVGIAYLLGFLFNSISQNSKETAPSATIEAVLQEQTPAPHERFTDKALIGTWKGSEKVNRGKEIKFTKRFGHIFIDEAAFAGDAVKYYYVSYRDGAIEFMPYYTSDAPKTTIAPDGSDDIYLIKGQYMFEDNLLCLTINGKTYKYKKKVETTPATTEEPIYDADDYDADVVDEADEVDEDTNNDAEEKVQKRTKKKATPKPTPKSKSTPKPLVNQPAEDSEDVSSDTTGSEDSETGADTNTEEDIGSGVDDYDPAA